MKYCFLFIPVFAACLLQGCEKQKVNSNYKNNPEPLLQNAYIKLPLGAVKPIGWLHSQLEAQAAGLTGNIDNFWPDLVNSAWHGGTGDMRGNLARTFSTDLFHLPTCLVKTA